VINPSDTVGTNKKSIHIVFKELGCIHSRSAKNCGINNRSSRGHNLNGYVITHDVTCPKCKYIASDLEVLLANINKLVIYPESCHMIRYVIAGKEYLACMSKTQCPKCGAVYFFRRFWTIECEECSVSLRVFAPTITSNMSSGVFLCGGHHFPGFDKTLPF